MRGGRFEVLEGPEGHENVFTFNENGKGSITGLTDVTEVSFTYQLIRGDGAPPVGPIEVTFEFNRAKFAYPLPPRSGPDIDVLCLSLGGLHYPLYQFRLTNNPFDNEPRPHWHWYFGVNVSALESPVESIPDPNPTRAGFGAFGEVSIVSFRVAYTDWLIFLESRPLQQYPKESSVPLRRRRAPPQKMRSAPTEV